jgi:predicted outer membrane repeat protein
MKRNLLLGITLCITLFSNAATITVKNTSDAGAGSFRQALADATNGDTIMFDLPSYPATINVKSRYNISNKNIAIIGPSNQSVTLEGHSDKSSSTQIFYLHKNAVVELKNLTLTKQSGGVDNYGQSLIYNGATLHINNCLLHNVVDKSAQGSVIYNAWAGNLFLNNSTFSGNYGSQGGAIYSTGNLVIESCTFNENYAEYNGGGIFWHINGGSFNCRNSIFQNSTCFKYNKVINSLGYNISNDGSYGFNACTDNNNISSILLNQLQDNGGPTYTHSLNNCSIALNNGDPNITGNDQRNLPVYGGVRDIGAFEEQTNLLSASHGVDARTECSPFIWIDGRSYTSDNNCNTHILIGQAASGCDSIVTLDLIIINSTTGTDTITACDSYTWIDGNTYTASNNSATFNIIGGAANGCDSLVTLDLTIIDSTTGKDTRIACNSYTWIDGNTYTASNNSATFNINGCDSLVTLDLTIINSTTGTDTITACNSYTWIDGNTYTASNDSATFNIIGGAANGCDSLVTMDLTIINPTTGKDTRTACNSFTWIDGNTYTASSDSATFNIIGGAASGCDSIVTLDLTIINSTIGTDTITGCDSYTWIDGNTYTASNNSATFNIIGGAANGCDSLVTMDLTIINSTTGKDTRTACNSFTWIDGNTYTTSNNSATFNINGCDSLVTLDLTIINSTKGTDTISACDSYTWIDGNTYTASSDSATFNIIGGATNGCDSLVTMDLIIINSTTGTDTIIACDSYTWIDGNTYTASNNSATFNIIGGAANGCDSLVTLDLTIIDSTTGKDTRIACNSYTWIDGNTYTASNNSATFNINGCDSLVTLDLTIINSTTGTDTITACNSYTWIDGNTYTASNDSATFNIIGGAANGCDSLVTMDLTIINSTTGTDTITACESYTWIDGNTYTASSDSATFNIIGGAANGCDSLVTMDLIIINSTTGTDTITACNSYTWIDGNTYPASNDSATFNIIGGAANGCDSLVTLDLTINSVSDITTTDSGITITANNGNATYQWLDCDNNNAIIPGETSQSFTASTNGNFAVELTENGCVDTTACVVITSVGIIENSFGDELLVFPNPTNGSFSIDLGSVYETSKISITDVFGKLINSKTMTQSQILNLSIEEPAGIYIISIQAIDKKAVIRLIKE